jgi:hypothetical protein
VPEGFAVARVLFDGANVVHASITLSGPETPLTIVLTSRPGAVSSVLRDPNQAPIRGAPVVLLPDPIPEKPGPGAIRVEDTGDDGAFLFRNVAPGNYRAVALTPGDESLQSDLALLANLAARAEPFEVHAAQTASLTLKR